MKKNRIEKRDIVELYEHSKFEKAIFYANKYLQIHPNDRIIRDIRGKSYKNLGFYEQAIEDFKCNLNLKLTPEALTSLCFAYYQTGLYKEALKLLPFMYKISNVREDELNVMEYIIKKSLNILPDEDKSKGYVISQIKKYNENFVKNVIINFQTKSNDFPKMNKNINIEYLFEIVKKNLDNSKKSNKEEALDVYYFLVPNIGMKNNNICNYLKVMVIPNTNKVVNIFVTDHIFHNQYCYLDCNYDILFNTTNKENNSDMQKRFYKRYNINN